jgi:hypothetical protein
MVDILTEINHPQLKKISDCAYSGTVTDHSIILEISKDKFFHNVLTLDYTHFNLFHHGTEHMVKNYIKDKKEIEVHVFLGVNMKIKDLMEMPQMTEVDLDNKYYDDNHNRNMVKFVKQLPKFVVNDVTYYHDDHKLVVVHNNNIVFISFFQLFNDIILGKTASQQNLWRDRKNKFHVSDDTKHLPFSIINDYFFDRLKCVSIMSDKSHSDAGKNYWKRLIEKFSHLTTGYVVGSKIHEINSETNLDDLWGDTDKFADIQLFITKKELNFDIE